MTHHARLVIQFPRDGALEQQLYRDPPASVAAGDVALDPRPPDADGRLEPPEEGEVVLSLPSPEALTRQADDVQRVIERTGAGTTPLVVVLAVAEQLREDELSTLLHTTGHTSRPLILCVLGDA